jgi:DNA-directed RNA polymerase sigma subunit (sigma70/sigma32)
LEKYLSELIKMHGEEMIWRTSYPAGELDEAVAPFLNIVNSPRNWIRDVRIALDLTSLEMAQKLNITRSAYSRFERSEQAGCLSLKSIKEIAEAMEIEVEKVEHIMKIKQDISSLDASVRDDEEDSVLADFIEDEDTVSPEESATSQLLKEHVKDMLGALTDREQKILKLRFGLEDGKSHTLEEVGQEFAVTRERIRQIEAKALAKLRKHKDAKKLHDYIK